MKIEFYEEYPSEETLKKLKLIKFPTKIFLAANSIEKFREYEKLAKSYKNNLEVAYWPIVKNSYWISSFSNPSDLNKLFKELNSIKNDLLIDLEFPLPHQWKMYLKNLSHVNKNKKIIKSFMEKNKSRITTAEHVFTLWSGISKVFGITYDVDTEKSIMWYSSMRSKSTNKRAKLNLSKIKNKTNYSISLGTIATGVLGNEPILSPENLECDLKFVKKQGFSKIIVFRLGGINQEHVKILEKFI